MFAFSSTAGQTSQQADETGPRLSALIRRDQLGAVRRSVGISLPVNVFLGITCLAVAMFHGLGTTGAIWFITSTIINSLRMMVCRWPLPEADHAGVEIAPGNRTRLKQTVDGQLRLYWLTALLSGFVWASIPILCAGFTNPQTLFYLSVVCGITAGAVTHGTAYARIPICFITPPLLSATACLLYTGGFDRWCLCATVLLYLAALIRSSRESEKSFREASGSKNEAHALASSLKEMHVHSAHVSEQLRHLAWHDGLTGLLNRAGFIKEVEQRLRATDRVLSFMLLDLDGFKAVNDAFGHHTGDQALSEISKRLRQGLSAEDLVGRLGGDEFAILHDPRATGKPTAELAKQLIELVAQPLFDGVTLGVSIGTHEALGVPLTDRLAYADEALYVAKSAGRNQHRTFDSDLLRKLETRRDIERDLPLALAEATLQVWFQPIFSDGGRRLESLEALLRWQHPVHGWINPPDVIFTAAMTGHSEQLLRFILSRVGEMIGTLCDTGMGHLRVAMNMSPREMAQTHIEKLVAEMLAIHDIPGSMLEIEITEETAMDITDVQARLSRLTALGVHIAIDDFGVGFSSLASLRHRDVGRVKIDRSFVSGLTEMSENQVLVDAVLQLGRSLNIDIVAEGVESHADLLTLRALGCETMQGYHLGRPMPPDVLLPWISSQDDPGHRDFRSGAAS